MACSKKPPPPLPRIVFGVGYEPLLCETFTDIESHEGTCYKAAGWTPLGMTEGHSRQRADFYVSNDRPKKLWIKPLRSDARERLCAKTLAPEHAAGETIGKGAPLPITAKELQPLAKALRSVPDPRAKNRSYLIGPLLCLIALGLLCGGTNLSAIVRHAGRLTQAQLRFLGIRGRQHSPGSKVWIYFSADALYANPENARLIVQEKGGNYVFSVRDNQPPPSQNISPFNSLASPFLESPREQKPCCGAPGPLAKAVPHRQRIPFPQAKFLISKSSAARNFSG